jgi:hypothetical protein
VRADPTIILPELNAMLCSEFNPVTPDPNAGGGGGGGGTGGGSTSGGSNGGIGYKIALTTCKITMTPLWLIFGNLISKG